MSKVSYFFIPHDQNRKIDSKVTIDGVRVRGMLLGDVFCSDEDLQPLRNLIGCDYIEIVKSRLPNVTLYVDENGAVSGQPINQAATELWMSHEASYYLRGNVIVAVKNKN